MKQSWKHAAVVLTLAAALAGGTVPAMAAADTTPPVLKEVSADRTTVGQASKIALTIKATDNQSGVEFLSLRFRSKDTLRSLYATSLASECYSAKDKAYHLTLEVPANTPAGDYDLYRVSLTDAAINRISYRREEILGRMEKPSQTADELLPHDLTITITEPDQESDAEYPVLEEVKLDRTYVRQEESVEVFVAASDAGSGIKRVKVQFSSPMGGELYTLNLKPEDYDTDRKGYVGQVKIRKQEPNGDFELYSVMLTDAAGNSRIYGSDDALYEYPDNEIDRLELPNEAGFTVDTPKRKD